MKIHRFLFLIILLFILSCYQVYASPNGIVYENVENDGFILRVNSVSESSENNFQWPENGYKFLLLDISIKNIEDVSNILDSRIIIEGSDGVNYTHSGGPVESVNGTSYFTEIRLEPNDMARQILPILVPKDVSGSTLFIEDLDEWEFDFIIDLSLTKSPPDPILESEIVLGSNKGMNASLSRRVFGSQTKINFLDERIAESVGRYWPFEEGWKYYIVKTLLTNIGEYIAIFMSNYFLVKAEDGFMHICDGSLSDSREKYSQVEFIAPNDYLETELIFRVPDNLDKFMLMYDKMIVSAFTDQELENVGQINEKVNYDSLIFYVNEVTESVEINSLEARNGYKFLLLDITVKNEDSIMVSYRPMDLWVETSDGKSYFYRGTSYISKFLPWFTSSHDIAGKDIIRGIMLFEIPENVTKHMLLYKNNPIVNLKSIKSQPDPLPQSQIALRPYEGFNITLREYFSIIQTRDRMNINFIDEQVEDELYVLGEPRLGYKFSVVKTTITNLDSEILNLHPQNFFLKDQNGFISYTYGILHNNSSTIEYVSSLPVNSGEKVEVELVFEVPENERNFMILFETPSGITPLLKEPITYIETLTTSETTSTKEGEDNSIYTYLIFGIIATLTIIITIIILQRKPVKSLNIF